MTNTINKKRMLSAGALLLLAFSLIYVSLKSQIAESKENEASAQTHIPTIFVHGYKGTYNSFKTMLYRFEENHWAKRELVIYISTEGDITWKGDLHSDPELPELIQVVFENNKASIAETSSRLESVMSSLKSDYGIDRVNIVGHSMGGLVSTQYLEKTNGNSHYPTTEKLAVIGSPFKGIDNENYHKVNTGEAIVDLKPESNALKSLVDKRESFPEDVEVLAIAGTGDQIVDVKSVFAIEDIVSEDKLQKKLIDDKKIDHSGLHETEKVDELLKRFLWN